MRIHDEKKKVHRALAQKAWFRGVGVKETAPNPTIVLSVAKGAASEAGKALNGVHLGARVVVREVGRIAKRPREGATPKQAEALFEAARSASFNGKR